MEDSECFLPCLHLKQQPVQSSNVTEMFSSSKRYPQLLTGNLLFVAYQCFKQWLINMALFYILTFTFFKYLAQMTTAFALHFVHDCMGKPNTLNGIWPLKISWHFAILNLQNNLLTCSFFLHIVLLYSPVPTSLHHEAFHQQFQVRHRTAAQLTTFSCQRATLDKTPNKTDLSNLTCQDFLAQTIWTSRG